ncbi:uncharacterized protein LOC142173378 [Nicotiana tabacum]|uniref:Uncharacterized protein LOC142173378 n=1 Tax=Nicotiana tabacum TaxID=4097 RepID=A0AC58TCW3_TOBAC
MVKHLARTSSDHRPLLIKCQKELQAGIKYFKFLDFWAEQQQFSGNPMWRLQQKLKLLSKELTRWSKDVVGNVYEQVNIWEAKMVNLEEIDTFNNTDQSREEVNKGKAEYIKWLGMQDALLRQKTQQKEGENNTKYFHSLIRNRKCRLQLHTIKDYRGSWVQGDDNISKVVVHHFKHLFNLQHQFRYHDMLNCVPRCINEEDNDLLNAIPDDEEIRSDVFSMNASSAAGPDGFNGTFYQKYWNIIKYDIIDFVHNFFNGKVMAKFYTHTCLILIPKVDSPTNFSEFKPISLSNFTSKIISKILSRRLNPMLEKLISDNHSRFVKGRMIANNVQLAQEIVHNIKRNNNRGNVVIKMDMAKAYDRLSWNFLMVVMRKFDFSEAWIDIIWRLVSDVWYSIMINGSRKGLFTSSQGLKQGDPLSPSLFIIGAEVLSRSLNKLATHNNFTPFFMDQRGPIITHLAYADDIMIFTGGDKNSIKCIKSRIRRYEKVSGQKVNNDKSFFVTTPNTSASRINRIRRASRFMDKPFPFNYLGCPIYNGRKTISLFDGMLAKIVKRLNGWQGKMLSYGGKVKTLEHVFNGSDAAKLTWNTIGNSLGIKHQIEPVLGTFKKWWETSSKNKVHNLILQISPITICWEIWKQWTSCKYGNQKKFQLNIMVHQAIWNIKEAISKLIPTWDNKHPWLALCQIIEKLKPIQSWNQVLWSTPNQGSIKANTDGSYIRERNKVGIGGIVRNRNGDLIMAFSMTVQCDNNNIAEALAAEFGMKWYNLQGYTNFILELDSMVIANMLINRDTNNLKIKQVSDRMMHIIQQANVRVKHCYREGNQVAECLAKLDSTSGNSMTINSYQQLPRCAKGYFLLDKWQMASIRTKYDKANFFVS